MVFLGDPIAPFWCLPRVFGYAKKSGSLYVMPQNVAVACPASGGSHSDDVVIDITIDARDVETAPAADALKTLQPSSTSVAFFPSSEFVADATATLVTNDATYPQGCYKTTCTITQAGGCGETLVPVKFEDETVRQVRIKLRSPDLNASGLVNVVDFATFSENYPLNPATNDCRDYDSNNRVDAADFAYFGAHNQHQAQGQYATQGSAESSAAVSLRFTEEFITSSEHFLYVDVDVQEFGDVMASLFAIVTRDDRLTLSHWIADNGTLGTVVFAPVNGGTETQFYFGTSTSKDFVGTTARLGRLVFRVAGAQPVAITDEKFVLVTGEVLIEATPGMQTIAKMTDVLERVLDPDKSRVYHNRLEPNFPNPFNPSTTIVFSIQDPTRVTLSVYDVAGRQVRELVNERRERGAYKVEWDGRNDYGQAVASGVYFYRLTAGAFTDTRKMTMVK